jgi:hypothetical protein
VFSNCRQKVKRQSVCVREIAGDKLNAAIHQVGNESDVPGKPVKLSDHKGCPM